jgi:isopentenyl diphosphate isomerase/L-lactate dehydrogenase-like FMN-dependent dehydrogenase
LYNHSYAADPIKAAEIRTYLTSVRERSENYPALAKNLDAAASMVRSYLYVLPSAHKAKQKSVCVFTLQVWTAVEDCIVCMPTVFSEIVTYMLSQRPLGQLGTKMRAKAVGKLTMRVYQMLILAANVVNIILNVNVSGQVHRISRAFTPARSDFF